VAGTKEQKTPFLLYSLDRIKNSKESGSQGESVQYVVEKRSALPLGSSKNLRN